MKDCKQVRITQEGKGLGITKVEDSRITQKVEDKDNAQKKGISKRGISKKGIRI